MQAHTSNPETAASSLKSQAIELLCSLIAVPSPSSEEQQTAERLAAFLGRMDIPVCRKFNNVWAYNRHYDPQLPTVLLNSHHDTVKPSPAYTRDPFLATIEHGKLYGLGSNDAGASLVSLLAAFLHFYERTDLKYNLIFCASAEEEISGRNGISAIIPDLGNIAFAVVGEPTRMQMALAEKGLLVLDCEAYGKAGHAARKTGENAIYKAMEDIAWFRAFTFPRVSELLGTVSMQVTMISAGTQHNVIPDTCRFTVDIRTTDAYRNEELLTIIRENVRCHIRPRSLHLQPSAIPAAHPLVRSGLELGLSPFGSPTLSDQALMPWPSLKMGPGDTARSHSADEFVYVHEIESGIDIYINLLSNIIL